MAGIVANTSTESPLLRDQYSTNEPGQRRSTGKAKKKGKSKGKKKRAAPPPPSRIQQAMQPPPPGGAPC